MQHPTCSRIALIGAAALVMFVVVWVTINAADRIAFPDLVTLIEQEKVETTVRNHEVLYTNPRDIKVQPSEVLGRVDRKILNSKEPVERVTFRTNINNDPEAKSRLEALLLAKKDIALERVLAELERREGTSGLAEKAARNG